MRRWRSFASEFVPEYRYGRSGTFFFTCAKYEWIALFLLPEPPNLCLQPSLSRKAGAVLFGAVLILLPANKGLNTPLFKSESYVAATTSRQSLKP
jgi:hypothetical protein